MASKNNQPSADDTQVNSLAERLFIQHWQPKMAFEVEHIAKLCLEAAGKFYETAANAGGALDSK